MSLRLVGLGPLPLLVDSGRFSVSYLINTTAENEQVLLAGGADPEHGMPSALECVAMFKQEETWKAKFESATGRGRASSADTNKATFG